MRIVGGRHKGRSIPEPLSGQKTRPTTDRTREAIASSVLSYFNLDLGGVSVLDAFAGTGALGLELASRGAESVTLVERDPKQARQTRDTVKAVGETGSVTVVTGDAFTLGAWPGSPYDVLFLDPPYTDDVRPLEAFTARLGSEDYLTPDALVIYQHRKNDPTLSVDGLLPLRSRKHGSTVVDLFHWVGEGDGDEESSDEGTGSSSLLQRTGEE